MAIGDARIHMGEGRGGKAHFRIKGAVALVDRARIDDMVESPSQERRVAVIDGSQRRYGFLAAGAFLRRQLFGTGDDIDRLRVDSLFHGLLYGILRKLREAQARDRPNTAPPYISQKRSLRPIVAIRSEADRRFRRQ